MPDFAVIIAAAGSSSRFGGTRSKLLETLEGESVLRRGIGAFAGRSDVRQIVVAASASMRPHVPALPRLMVCEGGNCRAESVYKGLREVSAEIEWVAVHDAARPLVSQNLIDRTLAAAIAHGAAVPALPVALTIRRAEGPLPAASRGVVPRDTLWAMQTPQIMRRVDLLDAFGGCSMPLGQVTDDAQLLEIIGKEIHLVAGEESNLKITTPIDLLIAQAILGAARGSK